MTTKMFEIDGSRSHSFDAQDLCYYNLISQPPYERVHENSVIIVNTGLTYLPVCHCINVGDSRGLGDSHWKWICDRS